MSDNQNCTARIAVASAQGLTLQAQPPLVHPLTELVREASTQEHPTLRLESCLQLTDGLMRMLAYIAAADALSLGEPEERLTLWPDLVSRQGAGCLSILLHSACAFLEERGDPFLPELVRCVRQDTSWKAALSGLRRHRVRVRLDDLEQLSAKEAQSTCDALQPHLEHVLEGLRFFEGLHLGVNLASQPDEPGWIVNTWQPLEEGADALPLKTPRALPRGVVLLLAPTRQRALTVSPYLYRSPDPPHPMVWLTGLTTNDSPVPIYAHPLLPVSRDTSGRLLTRRGRQLSFAAYLDKAHRWHKPIALKLDDASRQRLLEPPMSRSAEQPATEPDAPSAPSPMVSVPRLPTVREVASALDGRSKAPPAAEPTPPPPPPGPPQAPLRTGGTLELEAAASGSVSPMRQASPLPHAPLHQVGPYTQLQALSLDGMAHVYQGLQPTGEPVCLKVLPTEAPEGHVDMFLDEARVTACLNHPNIARFLGFGTYGGRHTIALELVTGLDLKQLIARLASQRAALPRPVAATIARAVASALHHAHTAHDQDARPLQLVHRDIGPHNILLSTTGDVKLIDFGVARATGRRYQDRQGIILGKPAYMSPEQSWDDPLDGRSDLFSLGIVLHEMLTGQSLFHTAPGMDIQGIIVNVRTRPIPSPAPEDAPPADMELAQITLRALERERDDRWANSLELHRALDAWLTTWHPSLDPRAELERTLKAAR